MQSTIEEAFEHTRRHHPAQRGHPCQGCRLGSHRSLDRGEIRVAEKKDGDWVVNDWLKKAVLLSFRIEDNEFMKGGFTNYYDKVPSKYADYNCTRIP